MAGTSWQVNVLARLLGATLPWPHVAYACDFRSTLWCEFRPRFHRTTHGRPIRSDYRFWASQNAPTSESWDGREHPITREQLPSSRRVRFAFAVDKAPTHYKSGIPSFLLFIRFYFTPAIGHISRLEMSL